MALPVTIPNAFANATASIPLSQLDTNFNTLANAVNGISDGSETLANVTATVANITTANVGALNTSGQVVFNDAGADVDFRVEGDTNANLLFVDASADAVGIGTNAPGSYNSSARNLVVGNASGAVGITISGGSALSSAIHFADGTTGDQAYRGYINYAHDVDAMRFGTSGSDAMRIDSSGNVGIGVSPAYRLDVSQAGATTISSSFAMARITGANATANDLTLIGPNASQVRINFGDTDSSDIGQIGYSHSLNYMRFVTNGSERMRITSAGYSKASNSGSYRSAIGNYHEFNQNASDATLVLNSTNASLAAEILFMGAARNTSNNSFYAINYYNDGASAYKFQVADSGNVTNTNNSYGAISDVKLKQDIVDAGSQWDDIKGLRIRKFRWKSDPDGFMQMGLVAQEAEEVSPGLIDEHHDYEEVEVPVLDDEGNAVLNEDGTPQVTKERNALGTTTKAVKYSVLYMKAVKALQEAMERIETLEAKVAALENA